MRLIPKKRVLRREIVTSSAEIQKVLDLYEAKYGPLPRKELVKNCGCNKNGKLR